MTTSAKGHKYILLGASRGLGWATYQEIKMQEPDSEVLLVSRKIDSKKNELKSLTTAYSFDLTNWSKDDSLFKKIIEFKPTHIIYFAGGGPHGDFVTKKWTDHEWALKINFLTPAQMIHQLGQNQNDLKNLKSVIVIGSSIAESNADPQAASYCAAKHALKGLITTLQIENKTAFKLHLFSPGYMETDLLPAHSWPRLENKAEKPEKVASELYLSLIKP